MQWKPLTQIFQNIPVPAGYTPDQLSAADVPKVVALLKQWYPDIVVGSETCHLDPDFYREHVFLAGGDANRDIFPMLIKEGDEIAWFVTFERNPDALTVTSRLGAIAPNHRGRGLANLGPIILETLGREMGAGLAYYYATLKIPHQQLAAEKYGFQLVGIVPAFDRDMVSPGVIKRVFEACYAKVLVPNTELFTPPPGSLTPTTQKLWDFLFT